jgi:hypothetical protein
VLRRRWVCLAAVAFVLAVRAWGFADPLFWDENCYVGQARFIAQHGFDWPAYRTLDFLRPPLFTGLLALFIRAGLVSITWLRIITFAVGALAFPLTWTLTRRLGGSARAAAFAVGMMALLPLAVAQIGLVLSDLPETVLVLAALIALLDKKTARFVVLSMLAVFCKESAYALCIPAALLPWLERRDFRSFVVRALPAMVPGLTLFAWLGIHRLLVGVAIPHINASTLGANYLWESFNHAYVEGGRWMLTALAIFALRRLPHDEHQRARLVAASFTLALPILFPGPLPRYMLPSLPVLASLAALGLDLLPRARVVSLAAAAIFVVEWFVPSWHTTGGHHGDFNLRYRSLVRDEKRAVEAAAAAQPRDLLAAFPMFFAATVGPEDHFLPAPLHATVAAPDMPLDALCRHDVLIDADQGISLAADVERLRAANAIAPLAAFGPDGYAVRVYRIRCP